MKKLLIVAGFLVSTFGSGALLLNHKIVQRLAKPATESQTADIKVVEDVPTHPNVQIANTPAISKLPIEQGVASPPIPDAVPAVAGVHATARPQPSQDSNGEWIAPNQSGASGSDPNATPPPGSTTTVQ